MNRRWFGLFLLAVVIAVGLLFQSAKAGGYGYYGGYNYGCSPYYRSHSNCYSGYCGPYNYSSYGYGYNSYGYSPHCVRRYNFRSAWSYAPWSQNPAYFTRYYSVYDWYESPTVYGSYTNFNDGYLYTFANGCYHQHCLIDQYAVKAFVPVETVVTREVAQVNFVPELGTTQYGRPVSTTTIRTGGSYQPTGVAALVNHNQDDKYALAAHELAKVATFSAQTARELSVNGQQIQREKQAFESQNRQLAIKIAGLENIIVKGLAEMQRGETIIEDGQLTPTGATGLVAVLQNKCIKCHGGEKTERNIDFRQPANYDALFWAKAALKTQKGEMPPPDSGIERLTEEEQKFIEAAIETQ